MHGFADYGDMNDHDFGRYLRAHGWETTVKNGTSNLFVAKDGHVIAVVFYDNINLTKKVFINKNA